MKRVCPAALDTALCIEIRTMSLSRFCVIVVRRKILNVLSLLGDLSFIKEETGIVNAILKNLVYSEIGALNKAFS